MRTATEILDDPQAPSEEVMTLEYEDRVRHPNCPEDTWFDCASFATVEAFVSPAYALYTLASPERWMEALCSNSYWHMLHKEENPFPERFRWEYWLDCLEHVGWIFDEAFLENKRWEGALRFWRQFVNGEIGHIAFRTKQNQLEVNLGIPRYKPLEPLQTIGRTLLRSFSGAMGDPTANARTAVADYYGELVWDGPRPHYVAECLWQWEHFLALCTKYQVPLANLRGNY